MTARYIVGDVFDVLATLEPNSVDLTCCSPPFLALRSYLPADHPDKAKEIGSEPTPADFLDTLLDVVEACDRVLAPHGSLCFELGDTYAGANGWGDQAGNARYPNGRGMIGKAPQPRGPGWPLAKSLCMIPTLFAASLAYGHNMLRPERTTPRWRIRNQIVWARPNPPVGALGDKYRPATSYVTVATKSAARYFDLDAVRTEAQVQMGREVDGNNVKGSDGGSFRFAKRVDSNPAGAPPLDYWVIPTHPYPGAHYATFPPELVVKPVKSMCPQRVCRVCGEPSRRITEVTESYRAALDATDGGKGRGDLGDDPNVRPTGGTWYHHGHDRRESETLGWSDCGHDDWRPGLVLDPFAGSGTTLAVATGHGRDAIGIDLDERNAELALDRVGPMFLTVEHHG